MGHDTWTGVPSHQSVAKMYWCQFQHFPPIPLKVTCCFGQFKLPSLGSRQIEQVAKFATLCTNRKPRAGQTDSNKLVGLYVTGEKFAQSPSEFCLLSKGFRRLSIWHACDYLTQVPPYFSESAKFPAFPPCSTRKHKPSIKGAQSCSESQMRDSGSGGTNGQERGRWWNTLGVSVGCITFSWCEKASEECRSVHKLWVCLYTLTHTQVVVGSVTLVHPPPSSPCFCYSNALLPSKSSLLPCDLPAASPSSPTFFIFIHHLP